MKLLGKLLTLVGKPLVSAACDSLGLKVGEVALDRVYHFLRDHFKDHSQLLNQAYADALTKAWDTLEVAISGSSLIHKTLSRREDVAFALELQAFLKDRAPQEFSARQELLAEFARARAEKLLTVETLDPDAWARGVSGLARFGDPAQSKGVQDHILAEFRENCSAAGLHHLGKLTSLPAPDGTRLIVFVVQYHFYVQLRSNPTLASLLTWAKLEAICRQLEGVRSTLAEIVSRVDELGLIIRENHLQDLQLDEERHRTVIATQELILQAFERLQDQGASRGLLRSRDAYISCNDEELRFILTRIKERYQELPCDTRRRLPQVLNGIARLEVGLGDLDSAQQHFQQVAQLVKQASTKAETHYSAYQTALARTDYDAALAELQQAVRFDPPRFMPFPIDKFKPERILAAGGFGVTFLCQHTRTGAQVVVKTLRTEDLDRGVDHIIREASILGAMNHPNIITLRDADYADVEHKTRPYLVMEYFGETLADRVQRQPLTVDEALSVGRQIAKGLLAAHSKGILHRDVKPANVLIRQDGNGWQVKLIDFGLALSRLATHSKSPTPADRAKTPLASRVAGTLFYAPPEQLGHRLEPVKEYSDVFGFGKTLSYALFCTHQPRRQHWQKVPDRLADLLDHCMAEDPKDRPQTMDAVLLHLEDETASIAEPPPPAEPRLPAAIFAPDPPTEEDDLAAHLVGAMEHRQVAHAHAKRLAEQQHDYAAAVKALETVPEHLRDRQLYEACCHNRDRAEQANQHGHAKRLAEQQHDYAAAVKALETVPEHLRDRQLYEACCKRRDRVQQLDLEIRASVRDLLVDGLTFKVQRLLRLQPNRQDLLRLLATLPAQMDGPDEITNSLGMKLILIEPGRFVMGSKENNEGPQHEVLVTKPFYLAIVPVTQGNYEQLMNTNPSAFYGHGPNHPVEQVSWVDACRFCERLSAVAVEQKAGRVYRLPSEAEWEYACRAGSRAAYCFGDDVDRLSEYAWFRENSSSVTHAVGSLEPNGWGLYDMHGNVWEWCQDWYDERFYSRSPARDPVNERASTGRVVRGGSWNYVGHDCRAAIRSRLTPGSRYNYLGFRVACVFPPRTE